jgi:hypothetical protein
VACSRLPLTWEERASVGDFPRDKKGSLHKPWPEAVDGIFGTHTLLNGEIEYSGSTPLSARAAHHVLGRKRDFRYPHARLAG